jgi:Spy/CpxP family protein refolding chaperone
MRVRLAAGAVVGAVFLAGLVLGFALDRGVAQPATDGVARMGERRGDFAPPPSGWIIDRLDMTDAQRAAVDSVVQHYAVYMGDLQREYRPRFQTVMDSANRALREVLTPEQLAQYDSIQAELRMRRGRGNPPRPR